jgi:hypothetical protein
MLNEAYFDDTEKAYIGRTDAYYSEEDDDSVFSPDYWTYSNDINDSDFAQDGDLYQLTKYGKQAINSWLTYRNENEYQRNQKSFWYAGDSIVKMNKEQLWNFLITDIRYSKQIRKGYSF